MAIGSNAQTSERIVTSRESAGTDVTTRQGPAQDVQIQPISVPEVQQYTGEAYVGGNPYQQAYEGGQSYQPSFDLGQMVESDMGGLQTQSQPQQREQQQERQQERSQEYQPKHFAGMNTSAMAPQSSRQTEDTATLAGFDMASARPMPTGTFDAGVDAGAQVAQEISLARENGYGYNTNSPMPSRTAMETLDRRNARRNAMAELAESDKELASARERLHGYNTNSPIPSEMAMETLERYRKDKADSVGRPDSEFNTPLDYAPRSREPRTKTPSPKRPSAVRKAEKDRAARAFKRPGVGRRVYGKLIGKASLGFREIGLGIREIMAVVEQNPSTLNALLSRYSDVPVDVTGWTSDQIADYVNNNEIYVGTAKPPDNQFEDAQRRRLVILKDEQRGVYLHPIMLAIYTADADGDDINVSLDPRDAPLVGDPMDFMVGITGKQNLNTDFLSVEELVDGYEDGKTARDYVREVMFSAFSQVDGRTIRPLVDAVVELGKTATKDGDAQVMAWGKVFHSARDVANSMTRDKGASDDYMSRLCDAVYFSMREISLRNVQRTAGAEILRDDQLPDIRSYDDAAIYKVLDGTVRGEAPRNFQDLRVAMHGFLGNIKGKNAPFRFTADIGKLMKMDSRLQIGDGSYVVDPNDSSQMESFFESTMEYAYSYRMSVEIKKAGKSEYYTQRMRKEVIKEVGFPERYETYQDFLHAFYVSYRKHSAVINEANLVYDTKMGIASESNRGIVSPLHESDGGITLSDLAEPLSSIYGTYGVGRMFGELSTTGIMGEHVDPRWKGNPQHVTKLRAGGSDASKPYEREYEFSGSEFWITGKYQSWSVRKFKNENRLLRGDIGNRIRDLRVDSLGLDNATAELYMLLCIADKQTGAASKFNENVYGFSSVGDSGSRRESRKITSRNTTVSMMATLLKELNRLSKKEKNTRDQMLYINDVVDALIMSGHDMFTKLGIDSSRGFMHPTKWAKKMIEHANNTEKLGGIRTAMVFDYRMERINNIMDNMPDPYNDAQYLRSYNNLNLAIDELAASSEVWHGIVSEMKAEGSDVMTSVFKQLTSGNIPTMTSISDEEYEWNGKHFYDAMDFWRNPGNHDSLRSVIEDLDMDRDLKWKIIADVVRYWENDVYLKSWEVGYQMEIGNSSVYSLGASPSQGALSTFNEFEEAFNRWSKRSMENVRDNIQEAAKAYRKKPGVLTRTLQNLDQRPWELVSVSDDAYADSILSVLDKGYDQSEKAKQNPWTNQMYSSLSFQRVGGYMNDITYTDDRLIGIQSINSVGIEDVIHILTDPSAELWVYNDVGQVGMVTRDILLSSALDKDLSKDDVTESDIWEFLMQEPRIASAIRRHSASVITDSEGTVYVGASLSTKETMARSNEVPNPLDHVKYLMRDHPTYGAIISMALPKHGKVTRNERQKTIAMENYLASQIYRYASSRMIASGAAEFILDDLGITKESLEHVLKPNYSKYLEALGFPKTNNREAIETAEGIFNQAARDLTQYIEEVRQNVPLRKSAPAMMRPDGIGPDTSSVASFWDVIQELSGAKTMVSTGVEGAETFQFAQWATKMNVKDRFADLEVVYDDVSGVEWNGLETNLRNPDGSPITLQVDESGTITNYDEIMQAKQSQGMDEVVVVVPDGYTVQDRSTDSFGQPVSSFSMYMVSKRANGAETFNLKAKKSGIDGKDSITKREGKYRMVDDGTGTGNQVRANFFDIEYQLRQLHQQNGEYGLMMAKQQLAIMLMQENADLGYKDLTLSNYMCLADLMLVEDEEGVLHLRSLEMLMNAVKNRIGIKIDEMDDDQSREAATAIMRDNTETGVGISRMTSLEAFDNIRPKAMASSSNAIRPHSSAFNRNYDLLSTIRDFAKGIGVEPISPNIASDINEKMRSVKGIEDTLNRIEVTKNYSVVGFAGAANGSEEINWTVGASNAIVIGNGLISDQRVDEICYKAFELGMTVVVDVSNIDKIPMEFREDAMLCSDSGDVIIPCFDMRLNGAEAMPYNGGRFAIMEVPFSKYTVTIEDPINAFNLTDAQYKPTRHFIDRTSVKDGNSVPLLAQDMFANVYNNPDFGNRNLYVTFASYDDIVSKIVMNGVRCTIDYGVVEDGEGFEQRVSDVNAAIERYRNRFQETNPDGFLLGVDCEPGDIVGWMEVEMHDPYTDDTQYVLSPIIPFPLHGPTKNVPEVYRVQQVATVDNDNTVISVDWSNSTNFEDGGYVKTFDSSGGANKGMMSLSTPIEDKVRLLDGTMVDLYGAKESTAGRKVGTDKRIKSMVSLMALARMHGYNFARSDGAFPLVDESNPDSEVNDTNRLLKEGLLVHEPGSPGISSMEWRGFLRNGVLFTRDATLNAFLNYECMKILEDGGNPSDYLANVFEDSNGVEYNTHRMWEFRAMFELADEYEDHLLHFLHTMDPTFCPDGLEDESENYIFRLSKEEGYERNSLEVKAPFPLDDGSTLYIWAVPSVGLSFFGEDYSGFSRPNIDGASNFMDAMNTYAYKGVRLDEQSQRFMNLWATSDLGRLPPEDGSIGKV